jgi:hypothetical protein
MRRIVRSMAIRLGALKSEGKDRDCCPEAVPKLSRGCPGTLSRDTRLPRSSHPAYLIGLQKVACSQ